MSYTALYRKFRPQEFGDVRGQDAVVTTLKNPTESDTHICFAAQGEREKHPSPRFLPKR